MQKYAGVGVSCWDRRAFRHGECMTLASSINFDHRIWCLLSRCTLTPSASATYTYPCIFFAYHLGTSRLPHLTLWATFYALLSWQSGNLSDFGLHSHLSLSSLSLSPGILR